MKTILKTSRFYASHLKAPRGRGGWLFENVHGEIVFSFSGTYSEAAAAAKKSGHSVLYVCP